jgi:cell wall-associated NlpC family hydrolase
MKKYFLLVLSFSLLMGACSSSKKVVSSSQKHRLKVDKIIANALRFEGVKYKYGGTTKKGVDCSGIIFVAFNKENIALPRVSIDMAKRGRKISLSMVRKGDLLFFKTNKTSRNINHVGLVTSLKKGQIRFIHATSSKGVIVSVLSQKYWKNTFVKAVKILQ